MMMINDDDDDLSNSTVSNDPEWPLTPHAAHPEPREYGLFENPGP